MCLITFAYKTHPKFKLILAGNRDEFYARPTRKAKFWTEEGHPELLAGKDLQGGGTWLGVHKDGRWGALTNYRDFSLKKDNPPTRGELVLDYLKSSFSAPDYLESIKPKAKQYNGFNLLLGDKNGLYHFLNQEREINTVKPGIHGLSNASLDTPWKKLTLANAELSNVISKDEFEKEELFKLLINEKKALEKDLPSTGLSQEMEKAVSSIFIKTQDYGSRCSTILLIQKDGTIDFTERRFKAGTSSMDGEQHFQFKI
ncbi:MAG: NRDE family protein [Gracilimonas sp.]|nr:NRDE family protein [Gracilimonas sp.]